MSTSAREVLQALKPVQGFAEQVTRLVGVAHEAIRLEESLATTRQTLETLRTELAQARASQAMLLEEAKGLSVRLESEREAHLKALEAEGEAREAAIDQRCAKMQALARAWEQKSEAAEAAHRTRQAALAEEEAALETRVRALRDQAQRMLQSAEGLLR